MKWSPSRNNKGFLLYREIMKDPPDEPFNLKDLPTQLTVSMMMNLSCSGVIITKLDPSCGKRRCCIFFVPGGFIKKSISFKIMNTVYRLICYYSVHLTPMQSLATQTEHFTKDEIKTKNKNKKQPALPQNENEIPETALIDENFKSKQTYEKTMKPNQCKNLDNNSEESVTFSSISKNDKDWDSWNKKTNNGKDEGIESFLSVFDIF